MSYAVLVGAVAEKAIAKLDAGVRRRVLDAIADLGRDPRPPGAKKLKGQLRGTFRVRIGDWRVLYTVADAPQRTVTIEDVDHRSDVYRR